jgi:nitric oxide reductase subunit C
MLTKASTRTFFFGGTVLFTLVFIGLTLHTHATLAGRTRDEDITDSVRRGLAVWGRNNCENCHTLLGEGAYYAPDLTQIVDQRGERYLAAFLRDPSQFYSEERDGRLMPTLGLEDGEITDVIAFLGWVGRIDTNGWPPRPIRVSGASPRGLPGIEGSPDAASPVERGRALFDGAAACGACHAIASGVNLVGPSLAGVRQRAIERIGSSEYAGTAIDAEGYLRESLLQPDAYIAPGGTYATPDGRSLMPPDLAQRLTERQIDDLVAYLMTLE